MDTTHRLGLKSRVNERLTDYNMGLEGQSSCYEAVLGSLDSISRKKLLLAYVQRQRSFLLDEDVLPCRVEEKSVMIGPIAQRIAKGILLMGSRLARGVMAADMYCPYLALKIFTARKALARRMELSHRGI
ncbi:hypothetical protein BGX28_007467 [Mortierella sp. GBA30]|nr:hypothetical protein BGX28_007467 [Mortierella sp. GBA30]